MALNERQIAKEVESARRARNIEGEQKRGKETGCRKTHSVPANLFYDRVKWGRDKHGVDNIFNEPEFIRDCERHHGDWFKVPQKDGNRVCFARTGGGRPRTRFGRVSERIRFGKNGEKIVEKCGR